MTDVGTLTLSDFLLARIAEDEYWANESGDGEPGTPGYFGRVLTECEAKRRIVKAHSEQWIASRYEDSVQRSYMSKGRLNGLWTALQLLALPYASHPDYRAEWAV